MRSLDTLERLIKGFYIIISSVKDDQFTVIPSDINKMFAEPLFGIDEVRVLLSKNTLDDRTEIFSSKEGRAQLRLFSKEMKKTVKYLCNMKLRPIDKHHSPRGNTKAAT